MASSYRLNILKSFKSTNSLLSELRANLVSKRKRCITNALFIRNNNFGYFSKLPFKNGRPVKYKKQ